MITSQNLITIRIRIWLLFQKIRNSWKEILLVAIPILGFIVNYSLIAIVNLYRFMDNWDLGTFTQAFWSGLRGEPFLISDQIFFFKGFPQVKYGSFLAIHFSPIMYAFIPLFSLNPGPEILLVMQATWMGLGGIPVYLIGKKHLGRWLGYAFLLSYLLNPITAVITLHSFHIESLLVPIFLLSFYLLLEGKLAPYFLTLEVGTFIIEYGPIIAAAFNVLYVIYNRRRISRLDLLKIGIFTVLLLIYIYAAEKIRIAFGLDPQGAIVTISGQAWRVLGATSPLQVPLAILSNPLRAFEALTYDLNAKLDWFLRIVIPVMGLPILFPEGWITALPWLTISLFSNHPPYYYPFNFKYSFLYFFVYPSAIMGLKRLIKNVRRVKFNYKALILLTILVTTAYSYSSILQRSPELPTDHALIKHQLMELIPKNTSIMLTSDVYPYFARNREVYVVPPPSLKVGYRIVGEEILNNVEPEYIFVDLLSPFSRVREESRFVLDGFRERSFICDVTEDFRGMYCTLRSPIAQYGLYAYMDGIFIFKRGYMGDPLIFEPLVFSLGTIRYKESDWTRILPGTPSKICVIGGNESTVWFGPFTFLPPGSYQAEISVKVSYDPRVLPLDRRLFFVDVVYDLASKRLVMKKITADDVAPGERLLITLNFTLDEPAFDLEVRGKYPWPGTCFQVEYVRIKRG